MQSLRKLKLYAKMSKERTKNVACPNDVAKVARAELVKGIDAEIYSSIDHSIICDEYCDFICALLDKTPRPLAGVVSKGVLLGVSCSKAEAELFGKQIAAAVSNCRIKKRSFASGAKCSPGTAKIIKKLLVIDGDEPQPSKNQPQLSKNTKMKSMPPSPQAESPGYPRKRIRCKSSPILIDDDDRCADKIYSDDDLNEQIKNIRRLYSQSSFLSLGSSSSFDTLPVSSSKSKKDACDAPIHTAPALDQGEAKKANAHWISPATMTLNRFDASASVESVNLEPGPEGFCIAKFEGEPAIVTEVPNLVLEIYKKGPAILAEKEDEVKKRPASANKKMKRPASAIKKGSEEDERQDEVKKRPASAIQKKPAAKEEGSEEDEEQDEEDEDEDEEKTKDEAVEDVGGAGHPEAEDEPSPKFCGEKPPEDVRKEMRTADIDRRIVLYQRWGCTKCRLTACTPSCWKSRNMYEKLLEKLG